MEPLRGVPTGAAQAYLAVQAGTLALNKECCAADAVVRHAAANGLITARSRGIALRIELVDDAPLCIFTDPDRLGQVRGWQRQNPESHGLAWPVAITGRAPQSRVPLCFCH